MFGRLGWAEILVIVVLLVILFGSAKIPGMMRNLANGVNVFKRELKEGKNVDAPAAKKSVKTKSSKKSKKKMQK